MRCTVYQSTYMRGRVGRVHTVPPPRAASCFTGKVCPIESVHIYSVWCLKAAVSAWSVAQLVGVLAKAVHSLRHVYGSAADPLR